MEEKYMLPDDAARYVGRGRSTLVRWAQQGKLSRVSVAGRVMFLREELDALLVPQVVPPGKPARVRTPRSPDVNPSAKREWVADDPDLVTISEAARSIGCSYGAVSSWVRNGVLECVPGHGRSGTYVRLSRARVVAGQRLTSSAIGRVAYRDAVNKDDLVSLREAAKMVGRSVATIYQWVDAGRLVGVIGPPGRRLYVYASKVREVADEPRRTRASQPTMSPAEARSLIGVEISEKPFHVQIRIHNNSLRSCRRALGLSFDRLAKSSGVHPTMICSLENLKKSPKGRDGEWLPAVIRLSEFFGVLPEDLFPEELGMIKRSSTEGEFELADMPQFCGVDEALSLPAPDDTELGIEARDIMRVAEEILSPKELRVLREVTVDCAYLRDVGASLGISTERVRQIHSNATSKIRSYLYRESRRVGGE